MNDQMASPTVHEAAHPPSSAHAMRVRPRLWTAASTQAAAPMPPAAASPKSSTASVSVMPPRRSWIHIANAIVSPIAIVQLTRNKLFSLRAFDPLLLWGRVGVGALKKPLIPTSATPNSPPPCGGRGGARDKSVTDASRLRARRQRALTVTRWTADADVSVPRNAH